MWAILILIIMLFIILKQPSENFTYKIMNMPIKRENNIEIEHPVNSNKYDIDFKPDIVEDDKDIADVYDAMVDDGRLANQKYDEIDTYEHNTYFDLNDGDNYGYTNFMDYKKGL